MSTDLDHDTTDTPAAARAPRLAVVAVEAIPIRIPLNRVYSGSRYQMTHRSTDRHAYHTEDGIVGEAYCGRRGCGAPRDREIVLHEIAPALVGEDAFRDRALLGARAPATFDILRDRRLGLVPRACVDAALWDAVGKALGQPLYRLWGGYRDSCR